MGMVAYLRQASTEEVAAIRKHPSTIDDFLFPEIEDGRLVDFDKAWHALHFMLTGEIGSTDHPLNLLVAGDAELFGTDENGFGGFWLAEPDRVSVFASTLSQISDEEIAARYNPERMSAEQIYLSDVFEDEGAEALPYVLQGLPSLRRLVIQASQSGAYIVGALR
ncbi:MULTISPECIES: YfbM family protein [Sphingobium]|uniref:YfbM family protein n=1 Tax=Sphingobium TaxID=165695 RepID=UPI00159C306F|nr:YfbM family protein [Sphingobium sp. 15-1]